MGRKPQTEEEFAELAEINEARERMRRAQQQMLDSAAEAGHIFTESPVMDNYEPLTELPDPYDPHGAVKHIGKSCLGVAVVAAVLMGGCVTLIEKVSQKRADEKKANEIAQIQRMGGNRFPTETTIPDAKERQEIIDNEMKFIKGLAGKNRHLIKMELHKRYNAHDLWNYAFKVDNYGYRDISSAMWEAYDEAAKAKARAR